MIAEFAQVVGLLSAFTSGRSSSEILDVVEFLEWLSKHNHQDLREKIEGNHTTTISIKAMLNRGLEDLHEKLDRISAQVAILASKSEGVEDLALAYSSVTLSDQAVEILSLMESSGAEFFLLSKALGQSAQDLIISAGPNYTCPETRFFQDDLRLMVSLGLLRQDYNSRGDPIFYYTRAASNLVRGLP